MSNSWIIGADDTDDIVKQEELNFEPTKFKIFRDDFKHLLYTTRGCRGITMKYVIRSGTTDMTPITEISSTDVNINDTLASIAALYGTVFRRDNANIYTILHSTLTETMG